MQSASTPTFFPFFPPSEVERKGKIQLEKDEEGRETGGRYARYGRVQSSPFFIALPSPRRLLCSPGLLGPFSFPLPYPPPVLLPKRSNILEKRRKE